MTDAGCVPKGLRGFSILELMVSLAAALTVIVTVVSFTVSHHRSVANSVRYIQGVRELRTTMVIITRDIRRAGLNLDSSVEKVAQADTQALQLNMDVNDDATVENVTYSLDTSDSDNKKLLRSGEVLIQYVDTLDFYYYDLNGTTLASTPLSSSDRSKVRTIKFEVTTKPKTVSGREKSLTFTTRAMLRN
jgi:Tfp pilus assembly protein PilW